MSSCQEPVPSRSAGLDFTNQLMQPAAVGAALGFATEPCDRRWQIPYICDPAAAQEAVAAGDGAQVHLAVGGHSSERAGGPVELDAQVLYAGDKS